MNGTENWLQDLSNAAHYHLIYVVWCMIDKENGKKENGKRKQCIK